MCFVYAGAHVSGSNFNPAVTLTLALTGNMPWPKAITYMITQLVAGVAAAVVGGIMLEGDDLGT
jgi:glycerol uptake facilitator-like aquaporin